MRFPTGGKAREPKGRSGSFPEPTVKVWMEEDKQYFYHFTLERYASRVFLIDEVSVAIRGCTAARLMVLRTVTDRPEV